MFTIKNDLLFNDNKQISNLTSPHSSSGRNVCDFVLLHFTGTNNAKSSINWTLDPNSKVSFHLLVDQDGNITQFNNFRSILWHAGQSSWVANNNKGRTYNNLNGFSIGIELANAGKLKVVNDTPYDQWNNRISDVFVNETDGSVWASYTKTQIKVAKELSLTLARHYNCVDILSHEMVSPGRKLDTGPAFPIDELRNELRKSEWFKFS